MSSITTGSPLLLGKEFSQSLSKSFSQQLCVKLSKGNSLLGTFSQLSGGRKHFGTMLQVGIIRRTVTPRGEELVSSSTDREDAAASSLYSCRSVSSETFQTCICILSVLPTCSFLTGNNLFSGRIKNWLVDRLCFQCCYCSFIVKTTASSSWMKCL